MEEANGVSASTLNAKPNQSCVKALCKKKAYSKSDKSTLLIVANTRLQLQVQVMLPFRKKKKISVNDHNCLFFLLFLFQKKVGIN